MKDRIHNRVDLGIVIQALIPETYWGVCIYEDVSIKDKNSKEVIRFTPDKGMVFKDEITFNKQQAVKLILLFVMIEDWWDRRRVKDD